MPSPTSATMRIDGVPPHRGAASRHRPRVVPGLVAAGLLAVAAVLQGFASWTRWVTVAGSWSRTDHLLVDHRFDYLVPWSPWEDVQDVAQLSGAGYLLAAAAIVVLALDSGPRVVPRVLAILGLAVPTGFLGLHALWSGLIGEVSPLLGGTGALSAVLLFLVLPCVQLGGAIGLGILLASRPAWWRGAGILVATLLLFAYSAFGESASEFVVAPLLGGEPSQDSTSFYELVLAAAAALAAVVVGVVVARDAAARAAARR